MRCTCISGCVCVMWVLNARHRTTYTNTTIDCITYERPAGIFIAPVIFDAKRKANVCMVWSVMKAANELCIKLIHSGFTYTYTNTMLRFLDVFIYYSRDTQQQQPQQKEKHSHVFFFSFCFVLFSLILNNIRWIVATSHSVLNCCLTQFYISQC